MKRIYIITLALLGSLAVIGQSSTNCFVQIAFNSSGNLCFGDCNGTANAFPVGTGPYLYSWSNGATTQNLSGLCAGNYSVTVTDVGANTTCSGNGTITTPALLTVSTSTSTNTATATPSGGTSPYTYAWSPGGQTTATATGLSTGTYTVLVTDSKGCTASGTATVSMTGINVDFANGNSILIYPNPASDNLFLQINNGNNYPVGISVLNVLGETLDSETVTAGKNSTYVLNISKYPAGIYFISARIAGQLVTGKFLKN